MSARSAKPSLKKARISAESSKTSKKAALAPEARAQTKDVPTLSVKGKERAASPVPGPRKQGKTATKTSDPSSSTSLPTSFKVVCGSYEKLLYGLEGTVSTSSSDYSFHLRPIFIFPAHVSCIKSVAVSPQGGKWLATGSADEIIKVWDLRRRKEIGGLMQHQGSVTHLEFPSRSYMLSASEDGTLCLFRARDWAVLRELKGHKGRVNSVAVHQSCKVALSVGQDRTLRMWDLMRGKGSASTKIYKEGELVRWSSDGSLFALQAQNTIDIYSTDMELLHTIIHPSRLHDIKFCKRVVGSGELLLAGAEDKKLTVYDIPADHTKPPTVIAEMIGHTNRVKAVDTMRIALPAGAAREETTVVCTISSDGKMRLYDLAALPASSEAQQQEKVQLEPMAEYDTKGTRLTCVTLADGDVGAHAAASGKRKRADDDDEDDDEEGGDLASQQEDEESEGSEVSGGEE
ncbi:WD40 repeat-like protein [Polyporus arcularius HHB13444]|uniref:WD40 repeat-like protein n=1 Tax=Polyporus arcularius HHB13444 TaxID=1314778 RepID=A0A5C3PVH1_9APHY|nr:WD40 repeat-like protein [Polyporus arcularius HHB13444]